MVKSKFSLRYFGFFPLFLVVFYTLIIYGLLQPKHSMQAIDILLMMLLLGGPFFLTIFLLLRRMIVVSISPDRIQLRSLFFNKTVHKSEITHIDLSAREVAGLIGNGKLTNAIVIEWGKTDRIALIEFYYRNIPVLKQALQKSYIATAVTPRDLPAHFPSMTSLPEGEEDKAEVFAGSAITSMNVLLLSGLIISSFVGMLSSAMGKSLPGWGFYLVVIAGLYIAFGYAMFYFKVSDKYLIVKNHFFPGFTRGYPIEEISNVTFQEPVSNWRSRSACITTRGFFSRTYSAGSLDGADWGPFKERLETAGIPVKSEF